MVVQRRERNLSGVEGPNWTVLDKTPRIRHAEGKGGPNTDETLRTRGLPERQVLNARQHESTGAEVQRRRDAAREPGGLSLFWTILAACCRGAVWLPEGLDLGCVARGFCLLCKSLALTHAVVFARSMLQASLLSL